jgi:type VI secretion system protein ImpB
VKPLRELLDLRTRLSDLRGSLQGNEKLERLLQEVAGNADKMQQIRGEAKAANPDQGGSGNGND